MTDKLLQKINEWREQSLHEKQLRFEITKLLKDGKSDYYSKTMFEGFHATKTETKVKITHSEGWASEFIRPDVEVQIQAINKSNVGRPSRFDNDQERIDFFNAKRKKENQGLSDAEILEKVRKPATLPEHG